MKDQSRIRELLLEQFSGKNAHVDFDSAVDNLSLKDIGIKPQGFPHSIWELVEHIRIAQHDIVAFSQDPDYSSPSWPDGYWPESPKPMDEQAWNDTLAAIKRDHRTMVGIIKDETNNLLEPIPHGDGQTLFREAMLIVDHNAYHIGQIVLIRRAMDIWP